MKALTEIEGIEMGVFDDGTTCLSIRGLAKLCGVSHVAVLKQIESWDRGPREHKLAQILSDHGIADELLVVAPMAKNTFVVPETVAMAFIEYYAFELDSEVARKTYRVVGRAGFRMFVYTKIGYDSFRQRTEETLSPGWRQYHDRLQLNKAPKGYFFVYREMADPVLELINAGLVVDSHSIPDISAGRCFSDYWVANNLAEKYGERIQAPHVYPSYFPQSMSGPHDAYAYPIEAKGAFSRWLDEVYFPEKFPAYIQRKVKKGDIEPVEAVKLVEALVPKQLKK